jgi:hypothetical protein
MTENIAKSIRQGWRPEGEVAEMTELHGQAQRLERALRVAQRWMKTAREDSADKTVVLDAAGNITSVSLTATGEVAGAGTGGTATLTSTADVTQGCVTRGGGEPSGLERSTTTVTGSEPFTTDQGRGEFTVTTGEITAPSGGFDCPSRQQTEVLVSVIFNDPLLTINAQTGTITALFPDIDP